MICGNEVVIRVYCTCMTIIYCYVSPQGILAIHTYHDPFHIPDTSTYRGQSYIFTQAGRVLWMLSVCDSSYVTLMVDVGM